MRVCKSLNLNPLSFIIQCGRHLVVSLFERKKQFWMFELIFSDPDTEQKHTTGALVSSAFIFFFLCSASLKEHKYLTEREHQFGYLQDITNDVQLTLLLCVRSAGGGGGNRNHYSHYIVQVRGHSRPKV